MTILTKLLPDRPREMGMPRGAGPEITSTDVALVVGQLEPFEADVLLARDLGQKPRDLDAILARIEVAMGAAWARDRSDRNPNRKYIPAMAKCCWEEFINPDGVTHESRAFYVGISTQNWHAGGYKNMYGNAYAYLCDVASDSYRKVRRGIGHAERD